MKIFVSFLVASGLAQNANEYYYDYDTANNDTANYDTTNYGTAEWVPESALPQGKADAYATAPTGAMTCWHCDAMTFEECEANGQERECHDNEASCFLEIRERREGRMFKQIGMGCKSNDACQNMKGQNFQNSNPDYTQCRPESKYQNSVCRQCCQEPNCTKVPSWWYPQSREEWDYTGEEESYGYKK